jgi:hypothetical protein
MMEFDEYEDAEYYNHRHKAGAGGQSVDRINNGMFGSTER